MHEIALMEAVRGLALQQARRHRSGRIRTIGLRIGALAGVDPDCLRFAFAVAMEGTPAEGARLDLCIIPALCRCGTCRRQFEAIDGVSVCPACGTISRELLQGQELELASLELELPPGPSAGDGRAAGPAVADRSSLPRPAPGAPQPAGHSTHEEISP